MDWTAFAISFGIAAAVIIGGTLGWVSLRGNRN